MLIARTKDENLVTASHRLQKADFFCPTCQKAVILKKGQVMIPHFAHHNKADCASFSEGETTEHLAAKQALFGWGRRDSPFWQLEAPLVKLAQRPDLLWRQLAVEIQCSPLSLNRLAKRRENYQAHGYQDWWLLGQKLSLKKYLSPLQKYCCQYDSTLGLHLWQINVKQQQIVLLSHLQKSVNQLQFKKQTFSFGQGNLARLFYQPPKSTPRPLYLTTESYQAKKQKLQYQLVSRQEKIREIQSFFYEQKEHLLQLPNWYYLPSRYEVFFEERLLVLRYLLAKSKSNQVVGLMNCQQYLESTDWHFKHISKLEILEKFAYETDYLMRKVKSC